MRAKKLWDKALLDEEVVHRRVYPFALKVQQSVQLAMGRYNPELATHGLPVQKEAKKKSGEALVIAAAKSSATRQARHTMGPKQRKKITGKVPKTVVVQTDPVPKVLDDPKSERKPKP